MRPRIGRKMSRYEERKYQHCEEQRSYHSSAPEPRQESGLDQPTDEG